MTVTAVLDASVLYPGISDRRPDLSVERLAWTPPRSPVAVVESWSGE
jgi:hypothetical protein